MKRTKLHLFCTNTGSTLAAALALFAAATALRADETCSSPYLARIEGQEDLFMCDARCRRSGDGFGQSLVTLDVKPGSTKLRQGHSIAIQSAVVTRRITAGSRMIAATLGCGLETSKIFIFDVHTDPAISPIREDDCLTSRKLPAGP